MVSRHLRRNPKEEKEKYPKKDIEPKPRFEGPEVCERCYGLDTECPACHGTGEIE